MCVCVCACVFKLNLCVFYRGYPRDVCVRTEDGGTDCFFCFFLFNETLFLCSFRACEVKVSLLLCVCVCVCVC